MLIAHGLVTRAARNDNYAKVYQTRKELKRKQQAAKTKDEAKKWKKAQLPYKKMLNALSGGMKDQTNPAYDPRNNNCMCINGQLMLLDLIEHLEAIPGFFLIQSNTDGLIVEIPNTDEHFRMLDDICYEWEQRCSTDRCFIGLALDCISEIYQKDVNNYLWVDLDGGVERCGDYVKDISRIDNDLPILKTALVEYMAHGVPVEDTINGCDDLIQFQKVVKLSDKYKWVEHEHGEPVITHTGKRVIKTHYEYLHTDRFTYKCYRVFASRDMDDGRLLKCGGSRGKPEKFGNTPDHCFIDNGSMDGVKVPDQLDRKWYINKAKDRLKAFGITV
jgi:DNA polymerase